jgi:hypothetical protein
LQRRDRERGELGRGVNANRPGDRVLQERVEARMAPHALVVPISRVENATFAVGADPRQRLAARAFGPLHQDGAIRTELRVNVGLVPDLERLQPRQHRVRGIDEAGRELAGPVPLELRAQQGNVGGEF